jgi:DNA-nicking Smr family endonuclease
MYRDEFGKPVRVTDTLDLHGFFPEQAAEIVQAFIDQAVEMDYRTIRIIHGKGKSRMKWEVIQVLRNHPAVGAFRDAPPESGHWGVTVVEVRTKPEDQRPKNEDQKNTSMHGCQSGPGN